MTSRISSRSTYYQKNKLRKYDFNLKNLVVTKEFELFPFWLNIRSLYLDKTKCIDNSKWHFHVQLHFRNNRYAKGSDVETSKLCFCICSSAILGIQYLPHRCLFELSTITSCFRESNCHSFIGIWCLYMYVWRWCSKN